MSHFSPILTLPSPPPFLQLMSAPSDIVNAGSNVPILDPASTLAVTGQNDEIELRLWAAVLVGRRPGVFFDSGDDVMANVINIPGAIVLKFVEEAEARDVFWMSVDDGIVERVTLQHERKVVVASPEEPLVLTADRPGVRKWHVIYVGRQPGIFADKSQILFNTLNVPGARSRKFETYEEATTAFLAAVAAGEVEQVTWSLTREILTRSFFEL